MPDRDRKMKRKNTGHSQGMNLNVNWPRILPVSFGGAVSLVAVLILGSVAAWVLLLRSGTETAQRIQTVEWIVTGLVLAGNIAGLLFHGYPGLIDNFTLSLVGDTICALAGFLLGGVSFWTAVEENQKLIWFLQFLADFLGAFLLAVIPAGLICLVMWLLASILCDNM